MIQYIMYDVMKKLLLCEVYVVHKNNVHLNIVKTNIKHNNSNVSYVVNNVLLVLFKPKPQNL